MSMEDTLVDASTHTKGYRKNYNKSYRAEDGLPGSLSHVRAYPESPAYMALQVRSRDGRMAHVAHASLNKAGVEKLRDALNEWLKDR